MYILNFCQSKLARKIRKALYNYSIDLYNHYSEYKSELGLALQRFKASTDFVLHNIDIL